MFVDGAPDVLRQARVEDLEAGDVDGNPHVAPLQGPLRRLPAGFVDDPVADLADQAEALGQRDEYPGLIRPNRGWFQRASASTPRMRPVRVSILGW